MEIGGIVFQANDGISDNLAGTMACSATSPVYPIDVSMCIFFI